MSKQIFLSLVSIVLSLLIGALSTSPTMKVSIQTVFDSQENQAEFNGQVVAIPQYLAMTPPLPKVLGDSTSSKKIYVDLTNQRLYAYEGDNLIYNFLVSTGKWGRTPTGTFSIWGKFRFIKMSGGSKALHTYYYLPNVPFTMFFSNDKVAASRGFSIHGTYWHDNFGQPMSHGCINMRTSEAALIYNWSDPQLPENQKSGKSSKENPGTQVIIYGVTPQS